MFIKLNCPILPILFHTTEENLKLYRRQRILHFMTGHIKKAKQIVDLNAWYSSKEIIIYDRGFKHFLRSRELFYWLIDFYII